MPDVHLGIGATVGATYASTAARKLFASAERRIELDRERELRTADPGAVVWDEVVAFWIMLWLITPAGLLGQTVAFVLFRFFDMVKPPPIRLFEKRFKGGFGVMGDDIIAAFFTLLVFALWRIM